MTSLNPDNAKENLFLGPMCREYDEWAMRQTGSVAPKALREPEPLPASVESTGQNEVIGRPRVVCLCGSTRFYEEFQRANFRETMLGRIVLSVGFFANSPGRMVHEHGEGVGITPEEKVLLDELHKRKIDLADEVLVLNVNGYVGDSTRSEIEYAAANQKPIRWLESASSDPNGPTPDDAGRVSAEGESGLPASVEVPRQNEDSFRECPDCNEPRGTSAECETCARWLEQDSFREKDASSATTHVLQNALLAKFINRLIEEGGALVTSDVLSPGEIALSRATGRMFVTPDGFGLHLKPKSWLEQQNERMLNRMAFMAVNKTNQ
jgi:hypothetical protein